MSPQPLVRLEHLTRRFDQVVAVDDISLDIQRGEFVTFLGPSGSGKTTTLFAIAGFDDPTSGDILFEGSSVKSVPPHLRNIGMVFQRYTLFPTMDVRGNVGFPLSVRGRPRSEIDAAVARVLSLVRLDGLAERKPHQLSGGQQQRVALARALIYEPRLLLMDEPLGALDKKLREEIQVEIRRIHHETGVTIIYVTHDQEEALRMSDRIAVFNHGRIVQLGTGHDLYEHPKTAFVASFVGSSNFLACTVASAGGDGATVQLSDGSKVGAQRGDRPSAGAKGQLMIRPEKIRLARPDLPGETDSKLAATIQDVTYLGDVVLYDVTTASNQVISVREPIGPSAAALFQRDQKVELLWHSRDAHFFAE